MPTKPHIRWMIRRDMPEVLDIENLCFADCEWSEADFIYYLRQRNCIGMVAEHKGAVIGFMVYELHAHRLQLLNFAVAPEFQRQRVGVAMVNKLITKLTPKHVGRRSRILTEVRESNVPAQKFFAACGFKATSVLRDFYEDTDEDAYQFTYRYQELSAAEEIWDAALNEAQG